MTSCLPRFRSLILCAPQLPCGCAVATSTRTGLVASTPCPAAPAEQTPDILVDLASIFHLLSRKHTKHFPLGDVLNPVVRQAASGETWEAKCSERNHALVDMDRKQGLEDVQRKLGHWYREDALTKVLRIGLFVGEQAWLSEKEILDARERRLELQERESAASARDEDHVSSEVDHDEQVTVAQEEPPQILLNQQTNNKCLLVGDDRGLYFTDYYQALRRGAWQAFHEHSLRRRGLLPPEGAGGKKMGRGRRALNLLTYPVRQVGRLGRFLVNAGRRSRTTSEDPGDEDEWPELSGQEDESEHDEDDRPPGGVRPPRFSTDALIAAASGDPPPRGGGVSKAEPSSPHHAPAPTSAAAGQDGRVLLKWCDPDMQLRVGVDDYRVDLRARVVGHVFSRLVDLLSADVRLKLRVPALGEADCFFKNQRNVALSRNYYVGGGGGGRDVNNYPEESTSAGVRGVERQDEDDSMFSVEVFMGLQCNLHGLPPAVLDLFWKLKMRPTEKTPVPVGGQHDEAGFHEGGGANPSDLQTRKAAARLELREAAAAGSTMTMAGTRGGAIFRDGTRNRRSPEARENAPPEGAATEAPKSRNAAPQHRARPKATAKPKHPDVAVSSEFDVGLRGSLAVVNAVTSLRKQILNGYRDVVEGSLHSVLLQLVGEDLRWGAKLRDWMPTDKQTVDAIRDAKIELLKEVGFDVVRHESTGAPGGALDAAVLQSQTAFSNSRSISSLNTARGSWLGGLQLVDGADAGSGVPPTPVKVLSWNLASWPTASADCVLAFNCDQKIPPMQLTLLEPIPKRENKMKSLFTIQLQLPKVIAGFLEMTNVLLKELDLACEWTGIDGMQLAIGNGLHSGKNRKPAQHHLFPRMKKQASGAVPKAFWKDLRKSPSDALLFHDALENSFDTAREGYDTESEAAEVDTASEIPPPATERTRRTSSPLVGVGGPPPSSRGSSTSTQPPDAVELSDSEYFFGADEGDGDLFTALQYQEESEQEKQQETLTSSSFGRTMSPLLLNKLIDRDLVPLLAFKVSAKCSGLTLWKHLAGVTAEASWEFALAGEPATQLPAAVRDAGLLPLQLLDSFEITRLSAELWGGSTPNFPNDSWVVRQLRSLLRDQVLEPVAWQLQELVKMLHA